eukprot:CAMPEP_0119380262 /NCGR_PEP_ID=MMETSP1334-20130426/56176_1 /TAXON_ID=127549 /ORGANISM="Calcidiscus leptoporus, Strain RCC1130" /LENGTH=113 /DNA_ID=CAMNT_0007400015 /DNA_START=365 /DNA_END=705 /DNA_ORIENTATION=+
MDQASTHEALVWLIAISFTTAHGLAGAGAVIALSALIEAAPFAAVLAARVAAEVGRHPATVGKYAVPGVRTSAHACTQESHWQPEVTSLEPILPLQQVPASAQSTRHWSMMVR